MRQPAIGALLYSYAVIRHHQALEMLDQDPSLQGVVGRLALLKSAIIRCEYTPEQVEFFAEEINSCTVTLNNSIARNAAKATNDPSPSSPERSVPSQQTAEKGV